MGKKGRGNSDGQDFRHRIEGFGNGPMPPPVAESFEDRLHNALSNDDTVGSWYNSALAAVDSMVTAFDDNVNAIFDSIEDTAMAIVGDDDPNDQDQPQRRSNQPPQRRSKAEDDGERSGVNWKEVVAAICEEGDLENFVTSVANQCVNTAEEKEVGGLLSEKLLDAEKQSAILRILYVMQAVEESDLPAVIGVIRERCADKLEKLQSQTLCKSLAKQVYGPGAPASSSSSSGKRKEESKKEEAKPKAEAKPPPKPTDLLDFMDSSPKSAAQQPEQKVAAKPKAKPEAKATTQKTKVANTNTVDLLDTNPAPPQTGQLDLLDMATPTAIMAPQPTGDLLNFQMAPPAPAATTPLGVTPSPDPFGTFQASLPTTGQSSNWAAFGQSAPTPSMNPLQNAPVMGMRPGIGSTQTATSSMGYTGGQVQPPISFDAFDPNAKTAPRIPNTIANGPPMPMSGVAPKPDPFKDAFSTSGFSSGQVQMAMGGSTASTFNSGRSQTNQSAGKKGMKDTFDDVLSNELAKMQTVS